MWRRDIAAILAPILSEQLSQAWAIQHRLKARLFALAALTAVATVAPTFSHAQSNFQGLGFLPGGNHTQAFAVSSDGTVVVGSGNSSGGVQGFRWLNGTMNAIGFLPGDTFSGANGVNANGAVIVGASGNCGSNPCISQAIRGTSGIGFLPGGTSSNVWRLARLVARISPTETPNRSYSLGNWPFVSAALEAVSRHFPSFGPETGSQIEETRSPAMSWEVPDSGRRACFGMIPVP